MSASVSLTGGYRCVRSISSHTLHSMPQCWSSFSESLSKGNLKDFSSSVSLTC